MSRFLGDDMQLGEGSPTTFEDKVVKRVALGNKTIEMKPDDFFTMKEWKENGFIYQQFFDKDGVLVYQLTAQDPSGLPEWEINYVKWPTQ